MPVHPQLLQQIDHLLSVVSYASSLERGEYPEAYCRRPRYIFIRSASTRAQPSPLLPWRYPGPTLPGNFPSRAWQAGGHFLATQRIRPADDIQRQALMQLLGILDRHTGPVIGLVDREPAGQVHVIQTAVGVMEPFCHVDQSIHSTVFTNSFSSSIAMRATTPASRVPGMRLTTMTFHSLAFSRVGF